MKKGTILIIMYFFLLMMSMGCSSTGREKVTTSSPEPVPTSTSTSTYKRVLPPIVVDDPLLDLSVEDFKKAYDKLPDDYQFEINFDIFDKKLLDYSPSKMITKKQAERVKVCIVNMDEHPPFPYSAVSLKGLRYFPNIEGVYFNSIKLDGIDETGYLSRLESVSIINCDLDLGDSTEELRVLASMKKVDLSIEGCQLKNINFLKDFKNIDSTSEIFLGDNLIQDISPLSNLKEISYLDLSNNQIEDIHPLSQLKKVSVRLLLFDNQIKDIGSLSNLTEVPSLMLSDNKISDLTPLANLKKIESLWLDNNSIHDISVLSKLTTLKKLAVNGNPITDLSQLTEFIEKKKKGELFFKF